MPDTQLILQEELSTPVARANDIQITDTDSMQEAVALLSELNRYQDRIEAEEAKVLRPLLDAEKAERNRWKPFKDLVKPAIALSRLKISQYQTQATQIAKASEEAIASRVGAGKGKLGLETAVAKIANINQPDAKVQTALGSVKFRETPTLKITDALLIPREYLMPDASKLLTDLKAGLKIAGATIEIVQTPINSRR